MVTKEQAYKRALEIKKSTLNDNTLKYNTLLNGAYASNKRLSEIDAKLSNIGAQIAIKTISNGALAVEPLKESSQLLSKEKEEILKKYGIKEMEYACPLCLDSGYINGKICSCVKDIAKEIILKELSAEMPIDECGFDNFELSYYSNIEENDTTPNKRMRGILKLCKEYADNFSPETSGNLLFMGATGLGKTHLTLAIVKEVIMKGYIPIYSPADNLFSMVEKERFSNYSNESTIYNSLLSCDLLVIDDLGAEFMTSFSKSILYNLVNSRILSKKPTIINTNLTIKKIEELYSPRVSSRLIGSYDARRFLGEDIRQQKAMKG